MKQKNIQNFVPLYIYHCQKRPYCHFRYLLPNLVLCQSLLLTNQKKKKKSPKQETPTLLMCAVNSIVSRKLNKIFGSYLEHLPVFKAPRVEHLPRVADPRVQSGTTACFKAP